MTGDDVVAQQPEPAARPSLDFIEHGREAFAASRRRRALAALVLPAAITVTWAAYVTVGGHWPRVLQSWVATLTMVFGSFVGGSTPQGSGAIAFPVFTKVLQIPAEVARTFSLCIQTVGLGSASLSMLITRRRVEGRVLLLGIPAALVAFVATLFLLGDRSVPYWPMRLPGPYVKVMFTHVLAAMALVVYLGLRVRIRSVETRLPPLTKRLALGVVAACALGGAVTAMVGSGADVMLYLVVVLLLGLDARVGVPTAVITIASISVVGLALLGLWNGQLDVTLSGDASQVVAVGGREVAAGAAGPVFGTGGELAAGRYDLFGLWLAAIPAACWFGFLGAYVATRIRPRALAAFVAALAAAEVLTTALFLEELRTDGWLLLYAVLGVVVMCAGLVLLARSRRKVFALPPVDRERTFTRADLDVVPGFERQLGDDDTGSGS